jgi:hypothetical protein
MGVALLVVLEHTPDAARRVVGVAALLVVVASVKAVSSDMMIQSNAGSGFFDGHSLSQLFLMMPLSSGSISSPYSSCRPMVVPSYCSSCSKKRSGRLPVVERRAAT